MGRNLILVTICRDNPKELRATLRSVYFQSQRPARHIVIDGSNPHNSLAIKYSCQQWGAEHIPVAAEGIYPAMRAGLSLVQKDDCVWFLNSGDILANPKSVEAAKSALFSGPSNIPVWIVGKTVAIDRFLGHKLKFAGSGAEFARKLKNGTVGLPHSSTIVEAKILREVGAFDRSGIAEDYRVALVLLRHGHEPVLLDAPLSIYDETGASARNPVRTVFSKASARVQNQSASSTLFREPVRLGRTLLRALLRIFWELSGNTLAFKTLGWRSLDAMQVSNHHFCEGLSSLPWPKCCRDFLESEKLGDD